MNGNWRDIKGQAHAQRALEVAVAGRHHVLLNGPHGVGKTMLGCALPTIMPAGPVTLSLTNAGIPFQMPTHTVSAATLCGGASNGQRPLAARSHQGILFLDDLPDFGPRVLDALKSVLDHHTAGNHPARFLLVAAMNPCPCGDWGVPERACTCSPTSVARYRQRVPLALLDRIAIHVDLPPLSFAALSDTRPGEDATQVRDRVNRAWTAQQDRLGTGRTNADLGAAEVQRYCGLDATARSLVKVASVQMHLSARTLHHTLQVARTIADLAGAADLGGAHVAEAIQYRRPGRR